jgi:adenylate cyclase
MLTYWVVNPQRGAQQLTLLAIVWLHGCLGIHYWLRVKPWHPITVPTLRVLGVLVPLLAIGGFVDMGQEVARLAADPDWLRQSQAPPPPEAAARIRAWLNWTIGAYLGAVGMVFVARQTRTAWQQRRGVVRLTYPDGRQVRISRARR